ncbi:hypothetical protein VTN00DRAFT_9468 [Thermoascus crustaceus]|uniref:uncharacterized protein n=1 Tax=Thermoascus crustaceus TaxID=5088 RepID=UPI00374452B2
MHLLPILTTITLIASSSPSLVSAWSWSCDNAHDGSGLIQKPTCCNILKPLPSGKDARLGEGCFTVPDEHKNCHDGSPVRCCYEFTNQDPHSRKWACTSFAKWGDESIEDWEDMAPPMDVSQGQGRGQGQHQ